MLRYLVSVANLDHALGCTLGPRSATLGDDWEVRDWVVRVEKIELFRREITEFFHWYVVESM